ncbi:MAG TPA: endonuclease/exonuclease/phosphatase family protein [Actinomycetota bacterium]
MRVAAYNIQGGVRGADAIGGVLRDLACDVACLSEVRGSHLKRIARIAGRRAVFGPTIGLRRFGNAILSREPAGRVRRIRLSRSPGMEPRGLLVADCGGITVAATHLGHAGEERARHVEEILDALGDARPAILAGDFNEQAEGAAIRRLDGRFTDAFAASGLDDGATFPSSGATRRIDYVFVRGLTVEACEVPASTASDHLPVVATLDG